MDSSEKLDDALLSLAKTALGIKADVGITIIHRDRLHGLCGWYWQQGPEPRMLYATKDEAIKEAHAAIERGE